MPDGVTRAPRRAARVESTSGPWLATIRFGAETGAEAATGLTARVPNPPLAPDAVHEICPAAGPVSTIPMEHALAVSDGRSLFVAHDPVPADSDRVEGQVFDLYVRLLAGVTSAGFPHIVRIWNYVPHIHERRGGVDRYMRFCAGRAEAFAAHYGDGFTRRLPAASAVGCPGESIVVHLLASRDPVRHIENPRQISAYRYPARYGPKSPSFARGTVPTGALGHTVFVSGTASIVGHRSVFPEDPARQTAETMRNIEAVLDAAGVSDAGEGLAGRLRSLRVYVRRPGQLAAVRRAVEAHVGSAVPTAWVQAEICREELLVEIEATAIGGRAGA